MRLHVLLPGCYKVPKAMQPWELALTGADVLTVARAADRLGFESVLIPEHLVIAPEHVRSTGTHFYDAMTAQAVVAGATERIRVGSMVTILPLHNPIALAKAACTVDWLSGGRLNMTVGLGWQADEYRALGVSWQRRGRIADEYLAAMHELWTSEHPVFDGEFVSFSDITFEPKPVQRPRPPLWIGGDADAALRRAARFGDMWAPWLSAPAEIPEKLDRIRSSSEFDGRPFGVFYSLMALQVTMRDGRHTRGTRKQDQQGVDVARTLDDCAMLDRLGVTDTAVPAPLVQDLSGYLDYLAQVTEEIMPVVAGLDSSIDAIDTTSDGSVRPSAG